MQIVGLYGTNSISALVYNQLQPVSPVAGNIWALPKNIQNIEICPAFDVCELKKFPASGGRFAPDPPQSPGVLSLNPAPDARYRLALYTRSPRPRSVVPFFISFYCLWVLARQLNLATKTTSYDSLANLVIWCQKSLQEITMRAPNTGGIG